MRPLPRLLSAAVLVLMPSAAFAQPQDVPDPAGKCAVTYSAEPDITAVIGSHGWGFPEYRDFCQWLKTNNVALDITARFGVLSERSYGFAAIRLQSLRYRVMSPAVSYATTFDKDVADGVPQDVAMETINDAITQMAKDRDRYLASLRQEEGQLMAKLGGAVGR